jgi:hypothetical protein
MFFSTHILPNVGPKTAGPPMLKIALEAPEEKARREQHQRQIADLEKQLKDAGEQHYQAFARSQLGRTSEYLLAAWDYQHQGGAPVGLPEFAERRGLHAYALRQWIDYLGMGEYRLMDKAVRDVRGNAGVHGWKGEPDCPSLLVNSTDKEVTILTFKLPAKSVSVHPGPDNGVAVAWRSPVAGTVRVSGGVTDADPAGGDGIAWVVDHRKAGACRELATGDIPNGGAQRFDKGKGAERLQGVEVQPGDRIELLVLPKANYICDTTLVDLEIRLADGSKVWNLAGDVVEDLLQGGKGNPHADRLGNAGVWHFLDMAQSRRAKRPEGANDSLAGWERAAAEALDGKADRKSLEQVAKDFEKGFSLTDRRSPFWITRRDDEKALPEEARADLAKLAADLDALKKSIPPMPAFAHGAQDGGVLGSPHAGVHDVRIHVRGRYDRLGELVPRRFPEILAGAEQKPITSGSGRLQLAEWLTQPENPLTARVMVNRIWQYHFGQGLVRTPSNFGKLGERPTHPELLDYLAREFVASGWSVKQMHRRLMLSATYQQASEPGPETLRADPDNRLFGRMNRHRLEAEAVRDNLLAVSGRLDRKMGGPAVRDLAAPRRTLYLMTVRSDRSGFGPLFDSADPTAPVDRRTLSTVAPQALFLMNHPFVLEQTRGLAKRVREAAKEDRQRIERAYELLYGRPPLAKEVQIGLKFLDTAKQTEKAWEEYCQVLLCANEFIYVD